MFFLKACALGNDFVIFPNYNKELDLSHFSKQVANRRLGIGCDQVIFENENKVQFFNSDGSESYACGNGTQAVALWKMISQNIDHITISTVHEDLYCEKVSTLKSRVFFKRKPVIQKKDYGFFVDIGNPHFVYVLDFLTEETHKQNKAFFEDYLCNIEAVKVINRQNIEILIFERGAGPTPSCGTGSCAAALACVFENFTDNIVSVHQEGGILTISVEKDYFCMEGEVRFLFSGFYEG